MFLFGAARISLLGLAKVLDPTYGADAASSRSGKKDERDELGKGGAHGVGT